MLIILVLILIAGGASSSSSSSSSRGKTVINNQAQSQPNYQQPQQPVVIYQQPIPQQPIPQQHIPQQHIPQQPIMQQPIMQQPIMQQPLQQPLQQPAPIDQQKTKTSNSSIRNFAVKSYDKIVTDSKKGKGDHLNSLILLLESEGIPKDESMLLIKKAIRKSNGNAEIFGDEIENSL